MDFPTFISILDAKMPELIKLRFYKGDRVTVRADSDQFGWNCEGEMEPTIGKTGTVARVEKIGEIWDYRVDFDDKSLNPSQPNAAELDFWSYSNLDLEPADEARQ